MNLRSGTIFFIFALHGAAAAENAMCKAGEQCEATNASSLLQKGSSVRDSLIADLSEAHSRDTSTESLAIIGGTKIDFRDAPWLVSLVSFGGGTPWCGGVLVSNLHVLTAQTCMGYDFQVIIGGINFAVAGTHRHPEYQSGTADNNDIVVITLRDPVQFNKNEAKPARLPDEDSSLLEKIDALEYEKAKVSGFGRTTFGGPTSTVLMQVEVTITSQATCRKAYGDSSITDSMICAGEPDGGKSFCGADHGGPLIYDHPKHGPILVGIASWDAGCGDPGFPGVYTRVTSALTWIKDIIMTEKKK